MRSGSVASENFPVVSVSVLETRPACRVCGSPRGGDTHIYYQTSHQVTIADLPNKDALAAEETTTAPLISMMV